MTNYFKGNAAHPYHFSVGAVLINDTGEVCVHHYDEEVAQHLTGYWVDEFRDVGIDFYILMRETPELGESVESALKRGLMEEFGAEAEIQDYLGSIVSHFSHKGVTVEKTTIYILCKLVSQDLTRRNGDIESKSKLEWHTPEFLIPFMKAQAEKYKRTDVDESTILERLRQ